MAADRATIFAVHTIKPPGSVIHDMVRSLVAYSLWNTDQQHIYSYRVRPLEDATHQGTVRPKNAVGNEPPHRIEVSRHTKTFLGFRVPHCKRWRDGRQRPVRNEPMRPCNVRATRNHHQTHRQNVPHRTYSFAPYTLATDPIFGPVRKG